MNACLTVVQEVLEDVDSKILEEVSSFVKESSAQV